MPADDRQSIRSSLNWDEFYVSSNSEDLLPCLLSMYDTIAVARKLRNENASTTCSQMAINTIDYGDDDDDDDEDEDDTTKPTTKKQNEDIICDRRNRVEEENGDDDDDGGSEEMRRFTNSTSEHVDDSDYSRFESTKNSFKSSPPPSVDTSSSTNTTSTSTWCRRFRKVSNLKMGAKCRRKYEIFNGGRSSSPVSVTSLSSRYSVCSNGCSDSEDSIDGIDNEEANERCSDNDGDGDEDEEEEDTTTTNKLTDESLNSYLVSADDSDRSTNNIMKTTSIPQPRTSCTTSSQYSEDSGIYSNLIRSESLHDRSWFYADGEDFNYTNRVILEILETELVYVNDLHQIITGYLDEWRNDSNCGLSSEQIYDLFSNIEEIYNFNRCFLWDLEQCNLDPVKIARCFVENNSNFSIYASYCTHYPRSISILTELMRQEKTAHIFRDKQISLHHTLPLGSYLLKPVQRILKYHLLLQNMVKHTPSNAVGYNDITVALSTMTGIAHHINTMKRRHEHAVRVQEVQSLLTGWQGPDLTTFGELYAEGSFRISGAKALRHIFLFEHMLLVTKKKEGGILNYKTHILCSNLMLVECIPKEPLSFQVIPFDNPRLQFSVHARSLEEKRHWTLELKRVILENYNVNIPSHARQLVMELGQIRHSDNVSTEKICSPKRQHSTPEYLKKRKWDREKKTSMKSRLLPLFRKLDSLQNQKMRGKLEKNQFLSEGSIFSDTSANSDESYSNDSELQDTSKSAEDTPPPEIARTSEHLSSKSSECSSSSTSGRASGDAMSVAAAVEIDRIDPLDDADERNSYQQKEKLIEEIIGQLLIASQKFQKAIINHEKCRRTSSSSTAVVAAYDETDDDDDDRESTPSDTCSNYLKYAKECESVAVSSNLNTSSESLSASLNVLAPLPTNVWLKQQAEHLTAAGVPTKKAGSLPRTFQVGATAEDEWRANRPKTIASDKPTQDAKRNFDEITATNGFFAALALRRKAKLAVNGDSANSLNVIRTQQHPECKFYRTSVVRMTFKRMARSIGAKLSTSRRAKNERFYKVEEIRHIKENEGHYLCREDDVAVDDSTITTTIIPTLSKSSSSNVVFPSVTLYKQGSSDLGARIANTIDVSDYADPKVLFSTSNITASKKAASVLGLGTSYSSAAAATAVRDSEEPLSPISGDRDGGKESRSDCSADSFYERQFEEVECEFENVVRETSILTSDSFTSSDEVRKVGESFKKYSKVNVNISVHKLIKIPPPVPAKPIGLRRLMLVRMNDVAVVGNSTSEKSERTIPKPIASMTSVSRPTCSTSSPETSIPTRGWVKQVVNKFQSGPE